MSDRPPPNPAPGPDQGRPAGAVPAEAARATAAALREAAHPGYLGDLKVVDGVLRDLAQAYVERVRLALEQPDPSAAAHAGVQRDIDEATRVWRIFTGQDPAFRPTRLHSREAMDAHVLRHHAGADRQAPTLMAVVDFMTAIGAAAMHSDGQEANAEAQIEDAFATYTRLFAGLPSALPEEPPP